MATEEMKHCRYCGQLSRGEVCGGCIQVELTRLDAKVREVVEEKYSARATLRDKWATRIGIFVTTWMTICAMAIAVALVAKLWQWVL